MVENGYIDLQKLGIEDLIGVVNLYPWFGSARKELCRRMAGLEDGQQAFAEAAMRVGSRHIIADLVRSSKTTDWSDKEVEELLKTYRAPQRKVKAVGGDFFSQDDYDSVRKGDDSIFSSFASKVHSEREENTDLEILNDFCTETLAQIYLEQGYYEQAKYIYSRLLLRYPEKNTYFAALIEKLDKSY